MPARRCRFDLGDNQSPRPRPASTQSFTAAPRHGMAPQSRAQMAKQPRPKAIHFLSGSKDVPRRPPSRKTRRGDEVDSDQDTTHEDSEDTDHEEDTDAPRVAQWIDDDEFHLQDKTDDAFASLDSEESDDDDPSADEAGPSRSLRSLEHDLSTLPLGTLRSAQRSLAQAQALSDPESEPESDNEDDLNTAVVDSSPHPSKGKDKEKPDQPSKPKSAITKRSNKHAPIEVSSKHPVSRRRVVVDDPVPKSRDPRFMHAAGRYDSSIFKQQYDFLSGLRSDELSTLRKHMKRARKLVANSPSRLKAEREEEVKRLENAVKRAESAVNLDKRERVESKALLSAKQTEKEKRTKGKAEWWMKRSEKKELLVKARLDAIASAGGKQAVKRAVEKKQKKISQKEKKMRPFPQRESLESSDGKRRRPVGPVDARKGVKRRRVM